MLGLIHAWSASIVSFLTYGSGAVEGSGQPAGGRGETGGYCKTCRRGETGGIQTRGFQTRSRGETGGFQTRGRRAEAGRPAGTGHG